MKQHCLPWPNGPQCRARSRDKPDSGFTKYSRELQTDNCDVLARQVRDQLNF